MRQSLFPIHFIYTGDNAIQEDDEWQLVITTKLNRFPELTQTVKELRSYDVPECIALPIIGGTPAYLS
ncbi:MAG: divalent cation tolerance protein CutA [Cyanobacteria bacterium P01_F01_bin.150]